APYAILQHVEISPVLWMPALAIDKAVAVFFPSIWLYYSFYLLLGLVGLTVEKKLFIQYLYTIGWVTAVSHAVFLFLPNGVMRSDIDFQTAPPIYQLLASVDLPRNAMPSLHASLSVVAAIAVQFSSVFPKWSKPLVWLWVLVIFWSTIAIRQHVSLDLIAGSVIAAIVWWRVSKSSELQYHGV
ncbi:MAG: membrane-associated phospholipid phosphatase, partial [Cryomorphaceae bacterium]